MPTTTIPSETIAAIARQLAAAAEEVERLERLIDDESRPAPEPAAVVAVRIARALDPAAEVCLGPGYAVVRGSRGDLASVRATSTDLALDHLAHVELQAVALLRLRELARLIEREADPVRRATLDLQLATLAEAADWDLDAARAA